jgi:hypothetical protein
MSDIITQDMVGETIDEATIIIKEEELAKAELEKDKPPTYSVCLKVWNEKRGIK